MTTTSTCNFTIYRKPASAAALFDDLAPVGRVQEELAMAVVDASRRMHMWTVSIEWLTMHMFGRPRLPGDPPSTPKQLDDAAREAGVDVDFLETQIAEGGLHMLGKLLVVADRGYRQAQKAQSDALAAWHRELDRAMRAAMLADPAPTSPIPAPASALVASPPRLHLLPHLLPASRRPRPVPKPTPPPAAHPDSLHSRANVVGRSVCCCS
ncbi:MAG: hypothetical protein AB7K09_14045 [Planctomycetota bacterium]